MMKNSTLYVLLITTLARKVTSVCPPKVNKPTLLRRSYAKAMQAGVKVLRLYPDKE